MLSVVISKVITLPNLCRAYFCFILHLNTKLIALELIVRICRLVPGLVEEWPASAAQWVDRRRGQQPIRSGDDGQELQSRECESEVREVGVAAGSGGGQQRVIMMVN